MKRFLILLPALIAGFFIYTGQNFKEAPEKWNQNPAMTRVIPTGEYTPLPQAENFEDENKVYSTEPRMISTEQGDYLITPTFKVHPSNNDQSETPIVRHPSNPNIMFASSNAYLGGTDFSTGVYVTTNGGLNWFGSDTLNNGVFNYGDPGPAIDNNGKFYMTYIALTGNIGVSYSTNNGINWSAQTIIPGGSTSSDKNFTATDNTPSSPYYGRVYVVYTEFANPFYGRIVMSYSSNGGVSWSNEAVVSPERAPNHLHMGADIKINRQGEVNVVWANVIENGQNSTEDSLGFAKSTDGGVTWVTSQSNVANMNGIRAQNLYNNIRSNGFPRIEIDNTGGPRNGWIYASTSEKYVAPATDSADAILHRSTDGGNTWTSIRVNQDPPGTNKRQYLSAVHVDDLGGVNVIYYDTRNTPTNDSAEIYVSRSLDGGNTFTDILVSDHKFRPRPIPGLAENYAGDYIGITSGNGKLWPYWCEPANLRYQSFAATITIATNPVTPFVLTSPAAGSTLTTYPNSYIPSTFNWDTSASTAVYKWIFGSPTTSPRKIQFNITTNSLTVTTGQMDDILAGLGVAVGDSLVGQWDVWAFRNAVTNDSIKATNGPRAITLKRGIPPLTSFGLYTPGPGTTIETSAFNSANVLFKWATSGPGVTYKWKFGSPTISLIRLTYTSNISGVDSSFTIPNNQLDAALGTYGVLPGDSLVGQWSVWAYNGFDSAQASASNALTLRRASQAAVLVLYDSTNANGRISKDSVVTNLNLIGLSYQLYNKMGVNSTNSISFRGYNCVLVLGEGSNVMSAAVKDSVKAYLNAGTSVSNSKLIIFGEDVGYQFDRSSSAYYDSTFCRVMCGFQYVADRPGPVGQKGLTGITINPGVPDSSNGPSMDVLKISLSAPTGQTANLYKYTQFTDSMNAIGRLSPNYNVATFALDIEALRPAYNSPDGYAVRRILRGALNYVGVPTGTESNSVVSNIPQSFSLSQNYPNPFNPSTKIQFTLPQGSQVNLKIYNSLGKEVAQLVNEKKDAGTYNIEFNALNLASGVYYYQIQAGEFVETKRMLLLK
jgi:hypothetical protein